MSNFADEWTDYGGGRKAGVGALTDDELAQKLKNYKKLVAKRYRVIDRDRFPKFAPDGDIYISAKLDGELWFLVKRGGEVALVAYNGRVLQGVPVATEAEKLLESAGDIILPGELFALPPEGDGRPRVGHVALCLGDDDLAKNLGFRAFDLLEDEEENFLYKPYEERWSRVTDLLGGGKRVAPIPTEIGDRSLAADKYDEWVRSEKFEGLVLRSDAGITFKVKPYKTVDAVVIAFGERDADGRPEVRELTLGLLRDDGTWHVLGTVGTGFTEDARKDWHDRLSAIEKPSSFRMANREGTLCRFVDPTVIVEIKCSDIVDTDSRDMPVRRMTLNYDEDEGWSSIAPLPIVSLIHPRLERERDDKEIDVQSVGLDQIFQHVPFTGRDAKATARDLSESEVIRRGVYKKETKGKVAVRKYVAIKTNKADEDPNYPPYVIYYTDFSSGRKDPLKTDLRVTPDEDMLDAYIAEWLVDNVKRGWEEVSS